MWASPAWSGRRNGAVADGGRWGRRSGLALSPIPPRPSLSFLFPFRSSPSSSSDGCHPLQWSAGALGEMPDGDQVDILSSHKKPLLGRMRAYLPWGWPSQNSRWTVEVQMEDTWVGGSWRTPRSRRPPRKGRRQHGLSFLARGFPRSC